MYFGYFDLTTFLISMTNDMYLAGLLSKYLDHNDVGNLQIIFSEFSLSTEQYINEQIIKNTRDFDKAKAVLDVEFWEKKFKNHKKTLEEILGKLP